MSKNDDVTFIGDLNIHFDAPSHPGVKQIETLLSGFGLTQLIKESTHKNGHTLDVLITNKVESISDISVIDLAVSDHKTIFFTLDVCPPKRERRTIVTRNVRSIDKATFSEDLKKTCSEIHASASDSTVDQLVRG